MTFGRAMSLAVFLLCASCASVGANYDPAAVERLSAGMSVQDVHALLGQPNSVSTLANGSRVEVWLHSSATAFGTGKARSVSILFDSNGRMDRVINTTQTELR